MPSQQEYAISSKAAEASYGAPVRDYSAEVMNRAVQGYGTKDSYQDRLFKVIEFPKKDDPANQKATYGKNTLDITSKLYQMPIMYDKAA